MRKIATALLAGTVLLIAPAAQAKPELTGEQQLEKLLEGRVAGEPVSCISLAQARNTRIIDKTAIVYDAGRVLYVNRPSNADSLNDDDILVTKPHGSQLCRLETVRLHDRSSFFFSGFVGLNDFIPYRKVAQGE